MDYTIKKEELEDGKPVLVVIREREIEQLAERLALEYFYAVFRKEYPKEAEALTNQQAADVAKLVKSEDVTLPAFSVTTAEHSARIKELLIEKYSKDIEALAKTVTVVLTEDLKKRYNKESN